MVNEVTEKELVKYGATEKTSDYSFIASDGRKYMKSPITGNITPIVMATKEQLSKPRKLTKRFEFANKIRNIKQTKNKGKLMEHIMKTLKDPEVDMYSIRLAIEKSLENQNLKPLEMQNLLKLLLESHKLWYGDKTKLEVTGEVEHRHTLQNIMKKIQQIEDEPIEVKAQVVEDGNQEKQNETEKDNGTQSEAGDDGQSSSLGELPTRSSEEPTS